MSKFIIEESFWELFPESQFAVIVAKGIKNGKSEFQKEIEENLRKAEKESVKFYPEGNFADNKVIKDWREAFTKFKKKKGVRASIESLLKRVSKGDELSSISPLVDIYNAVSLRYGFPCGAEDIDSFNGNLRLTVTQGGDDFITLGSDKSEPTLDGEVCYLDDSGTVCRCWNWRESVRTMITENTTNAFIIMENIDKDRREELVMAMEELASWIERILGGSIDAKLVLDKDNREVDL